MMRRNGTQRPAGDPWGTAAAATHLVGVQLLALFADGVVRHGFHHALVQLGRHAVLPQRRLQSVRQRPCSAAHGSPKAQPGAPLSVKWAVAKISGADMDMALAA